MAGTPFLRDRVTLRGSVAFDPRRSAFGLRRVVISGEAHGLTAGIGRCRYPGVGRERGAYLLVAVAGLGCRRRDPPFLAVLITGSPVRRRFWCEQAGREVDVAFEEDGPPALRRYIAVVSCTAFSPSTLVQCHRACLGRDPSTLEIRRQPRAC
jgi:hypothetical protein